MAGRVFCCIPAVTAHRLPTSQVLNTNGLNTGMKCWEGGWLVVYSTGLRARQAGAHKGRTGLPYATWLGCTTGDPALSALALLTYPCPSLLTYPGAQSRLSRIPFLQDR